MDEKKIEELQNDSGQIDELQELQEVDESMEGYSNENMEQNDYSNEFEAQLTKKKQECDEYLDLLKRTKAEFDNYRKRSIKEKEVIYTDGFVEGIKQILPVIDSLERAITFDTGENVSLLEGVELVLKMFRDTLTKNEVEEIAAEGEHFDPHYHNAVMHIEDPNYEENVVVEVLIKGYKYKEKIIRYSMVKVAN